MNPGSPSQISSTTSSSFPSNDLMLQIGTKISTFIQNGQLQELSQFITMNNIPPAILTQFLSKMKYPFIINMHFSFQDKDYLYLVMDYLTGGDLRYHLTKHKKFST